MKSLLLQRKMNALELFYSEYDEFIKTYLVIYILKANSDTFMGKIILSRSFVPIISSLFETGD
jgi:hypothetical protein